MTIDDVLKELQARQRYWMERGSKEGDHIGRGNCQANANILREFECWVKEQAYKDIGSSLAVFPTDSDVKDERPPVSQRMRYHVWTLVDNERDGVMNARPGNRSKQLFRSTVVLAGLVNLGALDEEDIKDRLRFWASNCGLEHSEITATINRGFDWLNSVKSADIVSKGEKNEVEGE